MKESKASLLYVVIYESDVTYARIKYRTVCVRQSFT